MAHLPEKITMILRNDKDKIKFPLDSTDIIVEQGVYQAFICDAYNLKQIETAKSWGAQSCAYDPKTQQYIRNGYSILENLDNKPITNVKIIGIEHRGNGGRAYKVMFQLDGKDLYADMREETILDIMYNDGIEKGACLTGEYIWIADRGCKFIRVGSERYNKLDKPKSKPDDGLCVISRDWVLYKTQKGLYRLRMQTMEGIKAGAIIPNHNYYTTEYYKPNLLGYKQNHPKTTFRACKTKEVQAIEITLNNKKYKEGDEITDYSFFKDTRDYSGKKDLGFIIKTFDTKEEKEKLISFVNEWGLSKLDKAALTDDENILNNQNQILMATLQKTNSNYNYWNSFPSNFTIKNEELYEILQKIKECDRYGHPTANIVLQKGF
jgi:hypothetical protein